MWSFFFLSIVATFLRVYGGKNHSMELLSFRWTRKNKTAIKVQKMAHCQHMNATAAAVTCVCVCGGIVVCSSMAIVYAKVVAVTASHNVYSRPGISPKRKWATLVLTNRHTSITAHRDKWFQFECMKIATSKIHFEHSFHSILLYFCFFFDVTPFHMKQVMDLLRERI